LFSLGRARLGTERLWKVWWILGIPLASAGGALLIGAESLRQAGTRALADALEVMRLALFWFWFRLAWKCAPNVRHAWWTGIVRVALVAGLALTALT
jgi:hypothetical protein